VCLILIPKMLSIKKCAKISNVQMTTLNILWKTVTYIYTSNTSIAAYAESHHFPAMWLRRTRTKSSDWTATCASSTNCQEPPCSRPDVGCIILVHVIGRFPPPTPSTHSYAWMFFMCGVPLPKLNCATSMQSTQVRALILTANSRWKFIFMPHHNHYH